MSGSASSGGTGTTKTGFLKREDIIGKIIVGQDAIIVGTVKDLAVAVNGKIALQVEKKIAEQSADASDVFLPSDEILAVGDLILLRPSKPAEIASQGAPPQTTPPPPYPSKALTVVCPRCSFVNSQTSRFCVKCGSLLR